jgi:hypothetical protein
MKLVLIQGGYMANYDGRKQETVVQVHNWDFDVKPFVEEFRVLGKLALGEPETAAA